jgi:SAM-dependent methyltransferase
VNDPELHADWFPLDDAQHEAQVRGLLELLEGPATQGDAAPPVLDLGCGDGRVLLPLAQAGFDVVGVDSDEFALAHCAQRLAHAGAEAQLIEADFTGEAWLAAARDSAPYQAVLCLGNTFLLVHEIDDAITLLTRLRDLLAPGGCVYLDNFCAEIWREVSEGYWQEGVSEDGSMQLIWRPGENVIALRYGDAVDEADEMIRPGDALCRLWSLGDLRLLARLCGLGEPEILPAQHLMRLRRA